MSFLEQIKKYDPNTQRKLIRFYLQDQYKSSLFLTGTKLLGYEFTERTHGDIISSLQESHHRKLIVCPRGSFKSTLACVTYPIWLCIRNPNVRILLDSELYTNSKNFLREIKAHFENERLSALFGEFRDRSNWSEDSLTIKQRTIPRKESTITCA